MLISATCPECIEPIHFTSTLQIGQQLICENCKNDFEVTWLFPISLDYLDNKSKTINNPDQKSQINWIADED
jgi:hypothetical protein